MLICGLRPGEARGLKWIDLDLEIEDGRVTVNRSATRNKDNQWDLGDTKTKAAHRHIPMTPEVVTLLRQHRQRQKVVWPLDLVFPNQHGGIRNDSALRRRFKTVLKKAGLPLELRLCDLRHGCATLLLSLGNTRTW